MGLFTKSILILLVAVSTPILYRKFTTDNAVKFMSSHYSNYRVIDNYLRQSADYLDKTKDYLPDAQQLQIVYNKLNKQFKQFLKPAQSNKKTDEIQEGERPNDLEGQQNDSQKKTTALRMTSCPGEETQVRLWSKEELKKFDANSGEPDVLLGFLGVVYNVTINAQHYGNGADYNVFAGRDATRAFVTGNFTHDLHDDITDIEENMYSHFETWASFYGSSYQSLGRIEGKFFDSRGCATQELLRVNNVFDKIAQGKLNQREQEKILPDCNSQWNGELKQGKVWCSNKSGGIERDWAGVPRIYDDGESKKCVCLNLDAPDADQLSKNLVTYPGCSQTANECTLNE